MSLAHFLEINILLHDQPLFIIITGRNTKFFNIHVTELKVEYFVSFVCFVIHVFGSHIFVTGRAGLEPSAKLSFENRCSIGSSHDPEMIEQVRDRAGFPMSRLPQVQNVLRRACLRREVIDIPGNRSLTKQNKKQ